MRGFIKMLPITDYLLPMTDYPVTNNRLINGILLPITDYFEGILKILLRYLLKGGRGYIYPSSSLINTKHNNHTVGGRRLAQNGI